MKQVYSKDITDQEYLITLDSELHTKKWFEDGDFRKPHKLYVDFYRCMDFEYIGHLFYLLSEFVD